MVSSSHPRSSCGVTCGATLPPLFPSYVATSMLTSPQSRPVDITYASLAASFNQSLVHHAETLHRMAEMSKNRPWVAQQSEEQRVARERMALFPEKAEVLYVAKDIWVVSR